MQDTLDSAHQNMGASPMEPISEGLLPPTMELIIKDILDKFDPPRAAAIAKVAELRRSHHDALSAAEKDYNDAVITLDKSKPVPEHVIQGLKDRGDDEKATKLEEKHQLHEDAKIAVEKTKTTLCDLKESIGLTSAEALAAAAKRPGGFGGSAAAASFAEDCFKKIEQAVKDVPNVELLRDAKIVPRRGKANVLPHGATSKFDVVLRNAETGRVLHIWDIKSNPCDVFTGFGKIERTLEHFRQGRGAADLCGRELTPDSVSGTELTFLTTSPGSAEAVYLTPAHRQTFAKAALEHPEYPNLTSEVVQDVVSSTPMAQHYLESRRRLVENVERGRVLVVG